IAISSLFLTAVFFTACGELDLGLTPSGGGSVPGAPSVPTGVSATAQSSSSILVSWSSVSNAIGYYVYRSTSSSGSFSYLGAVSSPTTSYTNTGLPNNTTYWYRVTAVNSNGVESGQSSAVNATTSSSGGGIGLQATVQSSSIIYLSWNTVSNASYYNIYYGTSSSNLNYYDYSYNNYYNVNYLTSGTTYYFRVTAVNSNGVESGQSSIVSATPGSSSAIPLSSNIWANGSITVSGGEQLYSFNVTAGNNYYIWWNDGYQGNGAKTLDIKVSAYYISSGSYLFSNIDSGWNTYRSFYANTSGTVILSVMAYSNDTGTFGIVYNTSGSRPTP
ncbi:MAG: fibronectin type III domain-containing protein, partial [Treponema sp.]|nr:fibronectin type III domain-containing protein [Treponema sp.]